MRKLFILAALLLFSSSSFSQVNNSDSLFKKYATLATTVQQLGDKVANIKTRKAKGYIVIFSGNETFCFRFEKLFEYKQITSANLFNVELPYTLGWKKVTTFFYITYSNELYVVIIYKKGQKEWIFINQKK